MGRARCGLVWLSRQKVCQVWSGSGGRRLTGAVVQFGGCWVNGAVSNFEHPHCLLETVLGIEHSGMLGNSWGHCRCRGKESLVDDAGQQKAGFGSGSCVACPCRPLRSLDPGCKDGCGSSSHFSGEELLGRPGHLG
jgi:hypothetical protein